MGVDFIYSPKYSRNEIKGWDDLKDFIFPIRTSGNYISFYHNKKTTLVKISRRLYSKEQYFENCFVKVLYSKKENALLFKLTQTREEGALKISKGTISATGFMQNFGISPLKCNGKYLATKENIEGKGEFWVIYLDKKET